VYKLSDGYFNDDNQQVPLTFRRYIKLCSVLPRVIKANIDLKAFKPAQVTSRQLYDFVLQRILNILNQYDTKLIILWMPFNLEEMDHGLIESVNRFQDIRLIDGKNALVEKSIDPTLYYYKHPNRRIHAIFAEKLLMGWQRK